MICNQNGLTCTGTTKNPEDRISIKKTAFVRITHRFWYLQNVSYYTNAPGVKRGNKKKGGIREREEKQMEGKRGEKKKRLEPKNNYDVFISSKIQ